MAILSPRLYNLNRKISGIFFLNNDGESIYIGYSSDIDSCIKRIRVLKKHPAHGKFKQAVYYNFGDMYEWHLARSIVRALNELYLPRCNNLYALPVTYNKTKLTYYVNQYIGKRGKFLKPLKKGDWEVRKAELLKNNS